MAIGAPVATGTPAYSFTINAPGMNTHVDGWVTFTTMDTHVAPPEATQDQAFQAFITALQTIPGITVTGLKVGSYTEAVTP